MVSKVFWRLLWLGVLGGAVIGLAAAFIVTYITQALELVPPNHSPPGAYLLWAGVGIVWFLAVVLTSRNTG
jgi:formate/nitrite transporter FocA (FNT family)